MLYTSNDGKVKVDVVLKDETVWLTQKAMAGLFGVKVPAVSKHLANIYETGELERVNYFHFGNGSTGRRPGKNSLQNFSGNRFFSTTPVANHAELKFHE